MKNIKLIQLNVVVITALCATNIFAQEPAIPESKYGNIKNTHIVHIVPTDFLNVKVGKSNITGRIANSVGFSAPFGFLFDAALEAIIVHPRKDDVYQELNPYLKLISNFNFRLKYDALPEQKIRKNIIDKGLYDVQTYQYQRGTRSAVLANKHKPGAGSVLLLDTEYFFHQNFDVIEVATRINILKEMSGKAVDEFGDEEQEDVSEIYDGMVIYQSNTIAKKITKLEYWSTNGRLEKELLKAINTTSDLVVMSLNNAVNGDPKSESHDWEFANNGSQHNVFSGKLLQTNEDRVIVKSSRDYMEMYVSFNKNNKYVPKDEPEEEF